MSLQLTEETRDRLIQKARSGEKYLNQNINRFDRRTKSKIASTVADYNKIDMNNFFKKDVLDMQIKVHGETKDYLVRVSIAGALKNISNYMKNKEEKDFSFGVIMNGLIQCFRQNDVYVYCQCPDFHYRHAYHASVNGFIAGDKETRPSDETNPDDKLGGVCKHISLVLSNSAWVNKVASTINNYINFIKDHYQKQYRAIIYPAIFGKEFSIGTSLDYADTFGDDEAALNVSNVYGKNRTKFKPGNTSGIRFDSNNSENKEENNENI